MKRVLFLDDNDMRTKRAVQHFSELELVCVKTAADAIAMLREHAFHYVLLDHDLGGEESEGQSGSPENSGMTVAKEIASGRCKAVGAVVVHSLNTARAQAMVELLNEHGVDSMYVPFTTLVPIRRPSDG